MVIAGPTKGSSSSFKSIHAKIATTGRERRPHHHVRRDIKYPIIPSRPNKMARAGREGSLSITSNRTAANIGSGTITSHCRKSVHGNLKQKGHRFSGGLPCCRLLGLLMPLYPATRRSDNPLRSCRGDCASSAGSHSIFVLDQFPPVPPVRHPARFPRSGLAYKRRARQLPLTG